MGSGPIAYQWQKNGADITAAQSESLVLTGAERADSGALFRCIATSGLGKDTSAAARLDVKEWSMLPGLVWEAESACFAYPYTILSGKYLYNDWPAKTPAAGGQALFFFHVDQPGDYVVMGKAHAYAAANRSLYINIDAEPADSTMAWDIPIASGFLWRTVSWRGTGTVDTNQDAPKVFTLTAGDHYLVLRGKDEKVKLDSVGIFASTAIQSRPDPAVSGWYCRYDLATQTFIYGVPEASGPVPVRLTICVVSGEEMAVLAAGDRLPGEYHTTWQAGTAGVYLFKFSVNGTERMGKAIIIK
jgi:hypothetical protein